MAVSASLQFGNFKLLPQARELWVDGKQAPIGQRAFEVLLALAERAGQLVSKTELLDVVWPGQFVLDTSLQMQVSALRKLLGPDVIVTIPGRGYQFTAPLAGEPVPDHAAPAAPAAPVVASSPMVRGAPRRLSTLVGRKHDVDLLRTLLKDHVLVTVTGAGGIGKTHLAHAVAELSVAEQRDGVVWIELASLTDPAMIAATIARAMGLTLPPNQPPLQALIALSKPLSLLMVLDNAEHLHQALAPLVAELAAGAAEVRFLVTSQLRLNLPQEQVVRLAPLTLPDHNISAHEALEYDALALFVARVQALDRRFAVTEQNVNTIVNVCRRLDGIALALELAAARVPSLSLQTLSDLLDERFRLLTLGSQAAPTRQQTLMAAFDWSYALLSPAAQTLFRRLSVLVGGFTLAELMPVAGLDDGVDEWHLIDLLADLVERSLITVDAEPTPRYGFLESAYAFAQQKLAASDEEQILRRRYFNYYHDRVEQARRDYPTPDWPHLKEWLQTNYANIRAALHWAVEGAHDAEGGAEIAAALGLFWYETAGYQEANHWLGAASMRIEQLSPLVRARLLEAMGSTLYCQGRYAEAERHLLESVRLFEASSDSRPELADVYSSLGLVCQTKHDYEQARRYRQLALDEFRRHGDRKGEGIILANMGINYFYQGQSQEAIPMLQDALTIAVETLNWPTVGLIRARLAECLLETGDVAAALKVAQEAASTQRPFGAGNELAAVLLKLARVELAGGDIVSAANHLTESLQIYENTRHPNGIGLLVHHCAALAVAVDQEVVAAQLLGFSAAWSAKNKIVPQPNRLAHATSILAAVETRLGKERCDEAQAEGALLSLDEAIALARELLGGLVPTGS